MDTQQIFLLVINVIGGAAVIGSYIQGIRNKPGATDRLWGGVPKAIRPVYGISMLLSALGYFAFIYFLLFKVVPDNVQLAGSLGFNLFYIIFVGMLVPSAFWMPLTNKMAENPRTSTWVWVRIVLILVGLSSCALYWALLSIQEGNVSVVYWLAVAGSGYFAFHTAVLDMIIWPALWRR
jgi:hypothetical protein